ncbi:hypothetical protein EYC84_005453 [Monilinia fructicola]|uniref:Uncharacterized protein n=1 Tax=Monilinia fructicola TaxID=38448 RepID=A0A5M9JWK2_MONFR|nr:hypothetical protein EYC84_005453 [Monilinia fructicola]
MRMLETREGYGVYSTVGAGHESRVLTGIAQTFGPLLPHTYLGGALLNIIILESCLIKQELDNCVTGRDNITHILLIKERSDWFSPIPKRILFGTLRMVSRSQL